ncbi:GNAT family N-acetyltransferase [Tenacibaculum sp. Bg11-29]|uniref:GNAT family N-acetyltransferase n=1 Tax=Tenacibaculum sp. Bg11-29 TaxID=2058306 RepID=UPI000C331220|nr:GNAT family N-acetyltransferase [Tenacibaculum sp. Bg11-29]PKH51314.1 GNAT family N-acetyltransferase [Tenacibaculum sp. Bg11-29]
MKIRLSVISDSESIMKIIKGAQKLLASLNIDQWQDGYPNEVQILNDIKNNESYVILNKEQKIIATFMFTTNKEPNYSIIDGEWLTNNLAKYGVIHRVAVSQKTTNKGIAKHIISYCEASLKKQEIPAMRIDTHNDNLGMQHILNKLSYIYCGIITVTNGDSRLAFEKLLQ